MTCSGKAIIYRTLDGKYLHSEMACNGTCAGGGTCKEVSQTYPAGNLTIETKYCQCKSGKVDPLPPRACHVEIAIVRKGDEVLYASAICFGGGCGRGQQCKKWKTGYNAVRKGKAVDVEETECECGTVRKS